MINTFDVFDTILTRTVSPPSAVFLLLGKRLSSLLIIDCSPETFARARMKAEVKAYEKVGWKNSLHYIYRELELSLSLKELQRDQIMDLECRLEAELIRPVPGAKKLVDDARAHSNSLVFISDMYLPSEFIKKQLDRYGFWAEGDECYVSCEFGTSKYNGELFREVINSKNVSSSSVTHHGNDLHSDFRMPKKIGFQAKHFSSNNSNKYEQLLEAYTWVTEGFSASMASASKIARLTIPASNQKEAALREVTAGVIAPLLVGYVLWILKRAHLLGLKRLYFISRDGQILLDIATRLAKKLDISIEFSYIYGSRRAWNLPAITNVNEEQMAWIWDLTDFFSVRILLSRLGIKPTEISENLKSIGFEENDWSRNLKFDEIELLKNKIYSEKKIHNLILNKAAKERSILIKYFTQEGLLESNDWALVDLGWYGTLQNSLTRILQTTSNVSPKGFYFGLRSSPLTDQFDQREAYFFDERLNLGYINGIPRHGLYHILETFCVADHGTLIGYEETGHEITPILKGELNFKLLNWGFPIIRETLHCFIENLLLDSELIDVHTDVREACLETLKTFWLNPTYIEAKAWSDFPWEDGIGSESHALRLAESYGWKMVAQTFLIKKLPRHHRATWIDGSIALSSPIIRLVLKSVLFYSDILTGHRSRPNLPKTFHKFFKRLKLHVQSRK